MMIDLTTTTGPIPTPSIGPVVFVLDRTGSMATRDCVEGTVSRWEFAVDALRSTLVDMARRDPKQPVSLITCGTTVVPIQGDALYDVIDITNGDASFCIGQAALQAAWEAGEGHVIIIADGPPAQDTYVGELVLENPVAMRALFSRTYFLTVGKVDAELAAFAGRWPNSGCLEDVVAPDVEDEDDEHYLSDSERSEEYGATTPASDIETAPTEPPPAEKPKAKRSR